jgi:cytidylate kinase
VGELLAERLGYLTLDTGVMYRAVTWVALARGIPVDDEGAVTALAESAHIDVLPATVDDGRTCTVTVDGQDVSWEVRSAPVDANVSLVSAYPGVRREMVRQQQRVAAGGRVVMIGRDIGTVVMPDADLKVYLDATVDERARRRWCEKRGRGENADFGAVLDSMRRRDEIDSHREVSPLQAAADAVIVDTTDLGIDAVLDVLVNLVKEHGCPPA